VHLLTRPHDWMSLQAAHVLWRHEHKNGGALQRIERLKFFEQDGQRYLVWPTVPRARHGAQDRNGVAGAMTMPGRTPMRRGAVKAPRALHGAARNRFKHF
jgi:hypothetical protein